MKETAFLQKELEKSLVKESKLVVEVFCDQEVLNEREETEIEAEHRKFDCVGLEPVQEDLWGAARDCAKWKLVMLMHKGY